MTTAYFDLAAASRGQPVLREACSDETLIQRIAAGDRLAMRTLFARHRVAVYRWLLRLVNDEALAEDLLSDVFLDVWRQAASFEARASVSTWLLAIARYKALTARRRRTDAELDDHVASTVADPADGPDLVLEKKSTTELMRACLAELSPEHREVMDLVYYHEKSVREVARIIGIPEPTDSGPKHRQPALLRAESGAGFARYRRACGVAAASSCRLFSGAASTCPSPTVAGRLICSAMAEARR